MKRTLLIAALLGWASPLAAEGGVPTASPGSPSPQLAAFEADQAAFVRWMNELTSAQQPVQAAFVAMQARVQTILASGDIVAAMPEFRQSVVRDMATLDAVQAHIEAIEAPDFPALSLPEDLRAAGIKRATLAMNANIRAAFGSFLPLMDAVARRDIAAMRAATQRSMEATRLMLDSQLLIARAMQAPLPRGSHGWQMLNVRVLYMRVTQRIAGAWSVHPGQIRGVPALTRELGDLARELDETARAGEPLAEAELVRLRSLLAEAERRGDATVVRIVRPQIAVISRSRDYFALARDLAELLRREGASFASGAPTVERLAAFFQSIYPLRNRLEEIERLALQEMGSA